MFSTIKLLPHCVETRLCLVSRFERRPFLYVKYDEHDLKTYTRYQCVHTCCGVCERFRAYDVVKEVSGGPCHGDADHWNGENDVMRQEDDDDVRQPHATTVEVVPVGVGVAAGNAHVHLEAWISLTDR